MVRAAPVCYDGDMNWTELAPFIAILGALGAMWWRLDSKIESRVGSVEARIGRLEALLTENLIALNRDIGELKGASHTHTPD